MTKITKLIMSRIGTCRSGKSFDIPCDIEREMIPEYLSHYDIHDKIDMFCMSEAKTVSIYKSQNPDSGNKSLATLNRFFWNSGAVDELRPHLEELNLHTSAAYVIFGQSMILL